MVAALARQMQAVAPELVFAQGVGIDVQLLNKKIHAVHVAKIGSQVQHVEALLGDEVRINAVVEQQFQCLELP